MSKQDTPGVIAPPPLVYLAALIIGLALHYLVPTPFMPRGLAYGLGAVLILIGALILVPARREMLQAGTAIRPDHTDDRARRHRTISFHPQSLVP